jgi:hypothetical protein
MRIPKSLKKEGEENSPVERPTTITSEDRQNSLPRSDHEIESAGTAFLDVIGKSLGIRYVLLDLDSPLVTIVSLTAFGFLR